MHKDYFKADLQEYTLLAPPPPQHTHTHTGKHKEILISWGIHHAHPSVLEN